MTMQVIPQVYELRVIAQGWFPCILKIPQKWPVHYAVSQEEPKLVYTLFDVYFHISEKHAALVQWLNYKKMQNALGSITNVQKTLCMYT